MNASSFEQYLGSLGLGVARITGADGVEYTVVEQFEIPAGGLAGRVADIAIHRNTSVPYAPPAAIHTRPALLPMTTAEPFGTQASGIGPEWQYWSRRFDHPPTEKSLWAHLRTVLCDPRWPNN